MQEGTLAPGIQEWRLHVEVNGVGRVAESVSIDADIASDLPDQVAGVSGVSARTGTIQWAPQNPVSERPATPWTRVGAWPPQPGDRVDIWAGDENTSWKVFTGRIDTSEGGVDSFSSKIIDATDQLDRPISLDPVAHMMPGYYDETTDTANAPVVTGVQPWHAAYRALRAGGFGIPAPTQSAGSVVLQVDMQGSIMPDRGYLNYDYEAVSLEWGDGWTYLADNLVNYRPLPATLGSSSVLRLWMRWHAGLGEAATLNVAMDDERRYRIAGTLDPSTSMLTLRTRVWDGHPDTGTLLADETVTRAAVVQDGTVWVDVAIPVSGAMRYTVAQTGVPAGSSNGSSSFSVSLGANAGAGSSPVQVSTWGPQVQIRVGVLTLAQWQAMSSHVTASSVHAWGRGLVNSQYVSRTQVKRNARDLLAEIGAATLTAMWIDEHGVMQWAPSDLLYGRSPDHTVTTRDDVFELGWIESMQACRHKVHADFENAAVSISDNGYTKRLYQPDRAQDITGTGETEFIEVPADREWFGVDTSMWRASAVQDRYNEGKGSFYSAVIEGANDTWTSVGADYSATLERITPRTYKLTHANATGATVTLMTHPTAPGFRLRRRGEANPIIRGLGSAWFIDETVTAEETGPSWAGDMTVDLGAWAIRDHAQRVADWLGTKLGRPLVTLTDMEIGYDPRIQLGDVLRVESREFLGFSLDAIVIGKRETHGDGAHMSVTVRVLRTHTVHTTYAEFEAAYQGRTYQALESAWTGSDYQAFEYGPTTR